MRLWGRSQPNQITASPNRAGVSVGTGMGASCERVPAVGVGVLVLVQLSAVAVAAWCSCAHRKFSMPRDLSVRCCQREKAGSAWVVGMGPLECVLAPVGDERESTGVQNVSHPLRVKALEDRDHESVTEGIGDGWVDIFASRARSDVLDDRVCAQASARDLGVFRRQRQPGQALALLVVENGGPLAEPTG